MSGEVSFSVVTAAIAWSMKLGEAFGSPSAMANAQDDPPRADSAAAAKHHINNLKALMATHIVPGLQHGILKTTTSRPRSLTIEVTADPYTRGGVSGCR